jgi:hypothetical protein
MLATLALGANGLAPRRGFVGTYYSDLGLESAVFREINRQINFHGDGAYPYRHRLYRGGFSARWAGEFEAPADDTYTFHVDVDGGFRLFVDGELLLDRWSADAAFTTKTAKLLHAGSHELTFEYVARRQGGKVVLGWSSPGFGHRPLEGGLVR